MRTNVFHFLHSLRIFYTPHFLHSAFSTLRIFYTPHFLHSAFSTLRTPHYALRTPHSALRTPHSALRTPHYVIYYDQISWPKYVFKNLLSHAKITFSTIPLQYLSSIRVCRMKKSKLEFAFINFSPPAFSAKTQVDKVEEVFAKPPDEIPSKDEEEEEIEMETSEFFPVKPFSRNRRSAKSRLGLISGNQGFHSVKLPSQRRRTSTLEDVFNTEKAIDGIDSIDGVNRHDLQSIRRKRIASVSGKELWACARQHVEERKISFDERMSQVQNIARRYTIKHSQSMRRRAKEKAAIPRRSTMASSAANEAMKQAFHLKRNGDLQEKCRKEPFRQQEEVLVEEEGNEEESEFTKSEGEDTVDGKYTHQGIVSESDKAQQITDDERASASRSGVAPVKGILLERKQEEHGQTKDQQQATSEDKGKSVKRVSLLDITEVLEV